MTYQEYMALLIYDDEGENGSVGIKPKQKAKPS